MGRLRFSLAVTFCLLFGIVAGMLLSVPGVSRARGARVGGTIGFDRVSPTGAAAAAAILAPAAHLALWEDESQVYLPVIRR